MQLHLAAWVLRHGLSGLDQSVGGRSLAKQL